MTDPTPAATPAPTPDNETLAWMRRHSPLFTEIVLGERSAENHAEAMRALDWGFGHLAADPATTHLAVVAARAAATIATEIGMSTLAGYWRRMAALVESGETP